MNAVAPAVINTNVTNANATAKPSVNLVSEANGREASVVAVIETEALTPSRTQVMSKTMLRIGRRC